MPFNKTKKPVKKPAAKWAATKNTKLASATNGRPAKSAPPAGPPAPAKAQYAGSPVAPLLGRDQCRTGGQIAQTSSR